MQRNLETPSEIVTQTGNEEESSGDEDDLIAKLQSSGMPTKR